MNELESNVKALIIDRYGSMKKFSKKIDMPWTTLDSILKRGIANSNITNVLKITRELGLDSEKLVDGVIYRTAYLIYSSGRCLYEYIREATGRSLQRRYRCY